MITKVARVHHVTCARFLERKEYNDIPVTREENREDGVTRSININYINRRLFFSAGASWRSEAAG